MDIYQLRLVSAVDPEWLILERRGRAAVNNNQVTLDGERLEIIGVHGSSRVEAVTLGSGTLLEVWHHSNGMFIGAKAEDVDAARVARAARDEVTKGALREREERLRSEALAFNASLAIPARWIPGAMVDDSVHLEVTAHDMRDRDIHVLLKQAIHAGRLVRTAGDFLCKRRNGGKHLPAQALREDTRVSCSACLVAAKRWQNE